MKGKSIKTNKNMQNEPNLRQNQTFITTMNIMSYNEKIKLDTWSKRTQTKPILPALNYPHRLISLIKLSKRYCESCGPGEASGWYWTEKAESFFHRMPSTVLSFKFTCVNSISLIFSDFISTQKP